MYVFVSEDHMLDCHSCQTCYPLEIKLQAMQDAPPLQLYPASDKFVM